MSILHGIVKLNKAHSATIRNPPPRPNRPCAICCGMVYGGASGCRPQPRVGVGKVGCCALGQGCLHASSYVLVRTIPTRATAYDGGAAARVSHQRHEVRCGRTSAASNASQHALACDRVPTRRRIGSIGTVLHAGVSLIVPATCGCGCARHQRST